MSSSLDASTTGNSPAKQSVHALDVPERPAAAFRLVHASDLFLDSPVAGLTLRDPRLAEPLVEASVGALDRVVDTAIQSGAHLVVFSGGLCEGAVRGPRPARRFADALGRLASAGIRACWVEGDRDAGEAWSAAARRVSGVHRFGTAPHESIRIAVEGVPAIRIHGVSYQGASESRALASLFRRTDDAPLQIGVLWGRLGAEGGEGAAIESNRLAESGFDFWALGGSRVRRNVPLTHGVAHYPGTPQGRGFGDGDIGAKGCSVVDLLPGESPRIHTVRIEHVTFLRPTIDLARCVSTDEAAERVRAGVQAALAPHGGRVVVLRLRLIGATNLHDRILSEAGRQEMLRVATAAGSASSAWVDEFDVDTRPASDRQQLAERDDLAGAIARLVQEQSATAAGFERFLEGPARQRWQEAPPELRAKWVVRAGDLALSLVRSQENA